MTEICRQHYILVTLNNTVLANTEAVLLHLSLDKIKLNTAPRIEARKCIDIDAKNNNLPAIQLLLGSLDLSIFFTAVGEIVL